MSIDKSRRGFLKGLALGSAAAGTTAAAGTAVAGGGAHRFPGYAGRMGLLHDTTLCVGCRSCEQACNEVNGLGDLAPPIGDERAFEEPRLLSDRLFTVVNQYRPAQGNQPAVFRKHQCMHCNEPCCASVCFVKAFDKTPEGPVLYHEDLCVGCRYCVFACPYYALAYEYSEPLTPRVVRCTMCYPLITQGQNPACADACPTGAILYGEREELIEVAHERMRKNPGRYLPYIFGEHEFAGTSWLTIAGIPFRELGFPDEPQNITRTPLPDFTTSFLSLAPLVAAIFPGLLGGFYAFAKRKEAMAAAAIREAVQKEQIKSAEAMDAKLKELAEQAARDKDYAVERAVRDALRKAELGREIAAAKSEDAPKTEKTKPAPAPAKDETSPAAESPSAKAGEGDGAPPEKPARKEGDQ